MELMKKTYNGNHYMMLDFKVSVPASNTLMDTSKEFVIGGMVICQFKFEINRFLGYANGYIETSQINLSVSEMFYMADQNENVCYPLIRSQCFGINGKENNILQHKISDDKIALLHGIRVWNCKGTVKASEIKHYYDIKFIITIEDLSISPSPFKLLHDDTSLTDFELCGEDGSIIVHKMVLATYSPVLQTMLSGEWKETTKGKVELAGVTRKTLTDLKAFMYLRKLPEVEVEENKDRKVDVQEMYTRLEQLMKLASYLMISDLIQACTARLLMDLTDENAFELLNLGFMLKEKGLVKGILLSFENKVINLIKTVEEQSFP